MSGLSHRVGGGVDLVPQLAEGLARGGALGPLDVGEPQLQEPQADPGRAQVQLGAVVEALLQEPALQDKTVLGVHRPVDEGVDLLRQLLGPRGEQRRGQARQARRRHDGQRREQARADDADEEGQAAPRRRRR